MCIFSKDVSVADVINGLLLLVAVIGIFLTYRQIKTASKTQQATFFKELYSMMFSDAEIRKAYQQIEYNEFVYDETFHGSANEHSIDRLLSFSDLACYLYDRKMLTDTEMDVFRYELIRIYTNEGIQQYLNFLKGFYLQIETGTEPFPRFVSYCRSIRPDKKPIRKRV